MPLKMILLSVTTIARNVRCIALIGIVLCFVLVQMTHADQKFCGKTLTDALDLLCVHGYNEKLLDGPAKRSDKFVLESGEEPAFFESTRLLQMYTELNPLFDDVYANLLAKTRRRRKEGVYDECCRKGCSYSELAAYCR